MKPLTSLILLLIGGILHATDKPNFIYIMLDDAGYGDFSCYGQKLFKTPNIDRMAEQGQRMTQFYSGSTVCAPARCSLMTGLHTGHCQVRGNREVQPEGQAPMDAGTLTLPLVLSKAGYKTGMFGKWGLGAPGSVSDPANHFDTFYGYNCQRQAHTFYPKHLWSNKKKIPLDGETYSHSLIAEQSLKFIRKNKNNPFFAYIPFSIPHAAMQAPESYVKPFRKQFAQYEGTIGKYSHGTKVDNPVAAFAGMMTLADEDIGRILDLLKELKIDKNTFVLLTSDNGPHYEGGHKPAIFDCNGPLKGHKRDLTEGGIRVPTVAWWPGTIAPGKDNPHISAFWDLLPTYCDLAGIRTPKTDGISFAPSLRGQKQKSHEYLYWEFHAYGGKQAIRMGKWKAIRKNTRKEAAPPIALYDLDADIGETTNLADKYPSIVKQMAAYMDEAHEPHPLYRFASDPK